MANDRAAADLYRSVCKLAYTVYRMAIQPRLPFTESHEEVLVQLSGDLGDRAKELRERNPKDLKASSVSTSQRRVDASQAMFDFINNTVGPRPDADEVLDSVQDVIDAFDSMFSDS